MKSYSIVHPSDHRGLRHAVAACSDRTLCGKICDLWFTEIQAFGVKTIGCKKCKRIYERRVLA